MSRRRTILSLKRRRAFRRPSLRILVVSEGAKTEGLYLSLFVRRLRAANVSIDLLGKECGTDPLTVAEFARDRFAADTGYDICFCLIDRDTHPKSRFDAAMRLAAAVDGKSARRGFKIIVSNPCLEFWFLLHFVYSRAPFSESGGRSPAENVIVELRKHLENYDKANKEELAKLLPRTEQAIENSRRASSDALKTGESNPSTAMHEVIAKIFEVAPSS